MRLIYLKHLPSLDRICPIVVSVSLFLPFKAQYPINLIYIHLFICHLPKAPEVALYARSSSLDSTKDREAASLSHTRASTAAGFGARGMPPLPFGGVNIIIVITSKYLITFPCFYKTPPRISHYPHNLPYTHEQLYEYPPPCMLPRTLTSHWSSTKNNYQYAVSQIHDHATHT